MDTIHQIIVTASRTRCGTNFTGTRDDRRNGRMAQFKDNELAYQQNGKIICRPAPLRASWITDRPLSADGHQIRCRFSCSIRALDKESEQQMLKEIFFGTRRSLTIPDVVNHLAPAITKDAEKAMLAREMRTIVQDETQTSLCQSLRQVAERVAYSCGLELLAPFDLQIESASYRRQQLERTRRQLLQQRSAEQLEHLAHATELLKNFEQLREQFPELPPGKILDQLSPADQGSTLQMLLLASAQQTTSELLAVAGTTLIQINLQPAQPLITAHELPDRLGPLRSIHRHTTHSGSELYIGARDGIWVIPATALADDTPGQNAQPFTDGSIDTTLGFSSVTLWNDQLWACHSDAGLVAWSRSRPDAPTTTHRPDELAQLFNQTQPLHPRHLLALDEKRLLFGDGSALCLLQSDGHLHRPRPIAQSPMVALLRTSDELLTVHADGSLIYRDIANLDYLNTHHHPAPITAAGHLPWLGSSRLLLASDNAPILCISHDDSVISQFASRYAHLRQIVGSSRAIAALCPDRQRLIIWNSWDGRQPASELNLTQLTRHRIADITL